MAISLRLTKEEEQIFKEYAKIHNITVSDLVKQSVLGKIQDECDLELFKKLIKDYDSNSNVELSSLLEK